MISFSFIVKAVQSRLKLFRSSDEFIVFATYRNRRHNPVQGDAAMAEAVVEKLLAHVHNRNTVSYATLYQPI